MSNMTKQQALQDFKENVLPAVKQQYPHDKHAVIQAWNDYTDSLCKDRQITAKQYHNWSNPF